MISNTVIARILGSQRASHRTGKGDKPLGAVEGRDTAGFQCVVVDDTCMDCCAVPTRTGDDERDDLYRIARSRGAPKRSFKTPWHTSSFEGI